MICRCCGLEPPAPGLSICRACKDADCFVPEGCKRLSTGGAPVETGPGASPDTMVSNLDICGDVATFPPGEPEMCRRPAGHHGAHVARPSNPAESMWWWR